MLGSWDMHSTFSDIIFIKQRDVGAIGRFSSCGFSGASIDVAGLLAVMLSTLGAGP